MLKRFRDGVSLHMEKLVSGLAGEACENLRTGETAELLGGLVQVRVLEELPEGKTVEAMPTVRMLCMLSKGGEIEGRRGA